MDRRGLVLAAGAAAIAGLGRGVAAESADIRGTIAFEGGLAIPKGRLVISLEDPAAGRDTARSAAVIHVTSHGNREEVTFSLSPATARRIVVRLERADGWLIARASEPVVPAGPVRLVLNRAMY